MARTADMAGGKVVEDEVDRLVQMPKEMDEEKAGRRVDRGVETVARKGAGMG